jgi:dihydroorotate dehydrogenase
MVFEGPGLARRITTGMAALARADGLANIAEAIGRT